jgi:hypothetical protein|tara:strand:- start:420 stop:1055 length:636 start_codon:yes stop_codon:yes gene_type:complete
MTPWEIHTVVVANCNCAYGCPCQFDALPTYGTCEAADGFQIEKGFYGGVSLEGLSAGMLAKWPGPIHEGNGERLLIIDDQATAEQRNALEKIISGEDTDELATIFWVVNAMTTIRHETLYLPVTIEADIETRRGRVVVDGVFELNVEPINNPVTGAEHRARIEIPDGFEFTIAEMASGSVKTHSGIELPNNNDTHSHLAELHLNNSGIIRS